MKYFDVSWAKSEQPWTSARQLFAVAVVLPSAIVLIDHWAIGLGSSSFQIGFFYPCLVAQVMLLGWCVGRFVEPVFLRWIIFAWTIALMNAQAFTLFHYGSTGEVLGIALISSQVGMLVLWSILGPPPWTGRLLAAIVAMTVILAFLSAFDRRSSMGWPVIMLAHCAIVATICFFLGWCGFRLEKTRRISQSSQLEESERTLRFSLRDVFLWATALAPLMLVAKGLDVVLFRHLTIGDFFPLVSLAVILALTSLLGIWVSLGTGNPVVRTLVATVGGLLLGFALYWQTNSWYSSLGAGEQWRVWRSSATLSMFINLRDISVYLILMKLWLLAAMLMFLRASGYQLLRRETATS